MATRALIIGDEVRKQIDRVVDHASHNTFSEEEMREASQSPEHWTSPGDIEDFRCIIPIGFRCVFTIERQPIGWCKHLSVSVDAGEKIPNLVAVAEIAKEFGMRIKTHDDFDFMWTENTADGTVAVNALRLVEKDRQEDA